MQGAAPKKRSLLGRVSKWLVLGFVAFVLLVVLAVVGIRLYYTDARLTALVRAQLKKYVPLDVGIGLVELRLLHGIVIKDLRVGPPTSDYKENVLTLNEVRLGYRLWPLLDKKIAVDEVGLDVPTVVLEMQNGKWNVLAIADKFASDTPKEEPATQPEEDTGGIGVEINLSAATIEELSARIISPDIKAALNHVSLRVSGRYTGAEAQAKAELHIGDEAHGASKVRAELEGTGQATLDLRWDVFAEATSLSAGSVKTKLVASEMKGVMAGFVLPPQPLTLELEADASLLTQRAAVTKLTLALGKVLSLALKATAADLLGDVDLNVTQADLDTDLDALLRLLPAGMVPVRASGAAQLRDASVHARLSALKALTPFDAKLALRLDGVRVEHDAATLVGLDGALVAQLGRDGALALDLGLNLPELSSGGATVSGAVLSLKANGPASLMQGKLSSALSTKVSLAAETIALKAPSLVVSKTAIALDAKLEDLAAEKADAVLDIALGNVRFESPTLGVANAPLTLSLAASRRAPVITVDKLSLLISNVIGLSLTGDVTVKPKGVFDLALELLISDIDAQKAIALAPSKLRADLDAYGAQGLVGLKASLKGPVTADVAKHFEQDTFELLDAGTPFDLELGLSWKGLGARVGSMMLSGSDGSIGLVTKPKQLKAAIELGLAKFTMDGETPVALDEAAFTLDASYEKGEASGAGNLRLGRTSVPTQLTLPLAETSLDYELSYARGGEIAINRIALTAPTLGANVMLRGRVAKPERLVATKAWTLPAWKATWKGLQVDASLSLDINLPSGTKLLPGSDLTLGGGAGLDVDATIADGLVKIGGALKMSKLNVLMGDLNIKNLSGVLPFKQDLKKVASASGLGLRLVLSNKDILTEKPRVAYYSDLRSYGRDDESLRIERFTQGRTDISRIALNGRLEEGKLLVDHFALQALTGDLEGQLALQLSPDEAVRATVGAKFSNVDLSVLAKTPPGPDSQINGNLILNLQWSRKIREIDASSINLTRLGEKMLTALLLARDPDGKDESIQGIRKKIETFGVKVGLLRFQINHNLLTPELDAKIPFLDFWSMFIGKRAIELKPDPLDIKPYLEQYLASQFDKLMNSGFADEWLGWNVSKGDNK